MSHAKPPEGNSSLSTRDRLSLADCRFSFFDVAARRLAARRGAIRMSRLLAGEDLANLLRDATVLINRVQITFNSSGLAEILYTVRRRIPRRFITPLVLD